MTATSRSLRTDVGNTPTYRTWESMKRRCYNPNATSYATYGGKGVRVCKRWRESYAAFLEDMGTRPDGMTLDRIDTDKGYSPRNCRWADRYTQARNKSNNVWITYRGQSRLMCDWAEITGICEGTLWARYYYGWPDEDIIMQPVRYMRRRMLKPKRKLLRRQHALAA